MCFPNPCEQPSPSGFLKGLEYLENQIPLSLPSLGSWSAWGCGEVRDLALGLALLGLLFPLAPLQVAFEPLDFILAVSAKTRGIKEPDKAAL